MNIPRRSPLCKEIPAAGKILLPAWLIAWMCASLLVFPGGATGDTGEQIEGQPVAEIRVVDSSGQAVAEKLPALPLSVGKAFDFSAERESLRVLYRTGDYSDVRVSAARGAGGLRVDFVVERNFYNNVVRIQGLNPPPTEAAALAAMGLNLGDIFRESAVRQGVESLEETLRNDGFYQAKVHWSLAPHPETRQMDVDVAIDSGTRARVGDVTFENHSPYTDAELLRHAGITQKKKRQE